MAGRDQLLLLHKASYVLIFVGYSWKSDLGARWVVLMP